MGWLADNANWLINEHSYVCAGLAFVLGTIVGSFLNVCIYRLPLQKSILWPGSRCGNCLQAIRWYDNIPLLSYLRLGGKCRTCGVRFSSRYFWIEFLTGLVFAALFWIEVAPPTGSASVAAENMRYTGLLPHGGWADVSRMQLLIIWGYHAIFLSLLIIVFFTDVDYKEIPLGITLFGTVVGVIGATLFPWPWPINADLLSQIKPDWQYSAAGFGEFFRLPIGLQPWPLWVPVPSWLQPGTWELGLATSLAGALFGTAMIRLIRLVFGYALGKEAMGLGDADLMMMVGAFLGWQALIFVLLAGVFLGLIYAISLILRNRGSELPFGPFLAAGAAVTLLTPRWLAEAFQRSFFDLTFVLLVTFACVVVSFLAMLMIRMIRLIGQAM